MMLMVPKLERSSNQLEYMSLDTVSHFVALNDLLLNSISSYCIWIAL